MNDKDAIKQWCKDNLFGERHVPGFKGKIPLSVTQHTMLLIAADIIEKWEARKPASGAAVTASMLRETNIAIGCPFTTDPAAEGHESAWDFFADALNQRCAASGAKERDALAKVVEKLREDAHQYRSPFYTMTPHVETEEREYRAKMLTEIADEIEAAREPKEGDPVIFTPAPPLRPGQQRLRIKSDDA